MIDLSAHDPGRIHIAVHRYREDDFTPYIFRTNDYGEAWELLTDGSNGIPANHFVRVVREDPDRRGLLYAGTEFGMYISFDDGRHWQSFQRNLPVSPITDIVVHEKDLVIATQGRAFWVMEDLTPLHQINERDDFVAGLSARATGRLPGPTASTRRFGTTWPEAPSEEIKLEIVDSRGDTVVERSARPGMQPEEPNIPAGIPAAVRRRAAFDEPRSQTASTGTVSTRRSTRCRPAS